MPTFDKNVCERDGYRLVVHLDVDEQNVDDAYILTTLPHTFNAIERVVDRPFGPQHILEMATRDCWPRQLHYQRVWSDQDDDGQSTIHLLMSEV